MNAMSGWPAQEAEFYGETLQLLAAAEAAIIERVDRIRQAEVERMGRDPVEHVKARIKRPNDAGKSWCGPGDRAYGGGCANCVHDAVACGSYAAF